MSEQIPSPTGSTADPTENITPSGSGVQLSPNRILPIIINLLKGIVPNVRGGSKRMGTLARRVAAQITKDSGSETQEEHNLINFINLRQKLFEAVSKKDMPCNKPRPSTRPGKKRMVKACEGGKEKIVHFGAKGYGHNYSPKARKSFKARHKCGEKKSKLSAQYWACKNLWAGPKGSKKGCPAGRQCKY